MQRLIKLLPSRILFGWCNNCQTPTIFVIIGKNLREDVFCLLCGSSNRQRQVRYVFESELQKYKHAAEVRVWNTESTKGLHRKLKKRLAQNYVSSEFFDKDLPSGVFVNGVRHEDICNSSFPSSFFDFVISSDVLEHIPEPRKALKEISRVLKRGGKHVFTVPYIDQMTHSDTRARLDEAGQVQYLKEPIYHGDPLRPEGILVYTIFGKDLEDMCVNAGMRLRIERFSKPALGIVGSALVFVSEKDRE